MTPQEFPWINGLTVLRMFSVSDRHADRRRRSVSGGVETIEVNMQAVKCYYPNCEPPPAATEQPPPTARPDWAAFWSQTSTWADLGLSKPGSGDTVVIPAGMLNF